LNMARPLFFSTWYTFGRYIARWTHKNGASGNGMFVTIVVGITRRHKLKSEKLHY
jgi:hypothetical protein